MESTTESNESLISNQPIPHKYQTTTTTRVKEVKKNKAFIETFGHQFVKKKNKTKKQPSKVSPKKVRKEIVITIDDGGSEE